MHLEMNLDWKLHAHTSTPEHVAKTLILIQTTLKLQLAADIGILKSMDQDLKQHLESMEARFMSALNNRTDQLKTQIDDLRVELKAHVAEECEKVETKLLTEFHKWGRTSDMRTRQAITDTGIHR